ncbi:MAG: hypothetical protein BGO12_22105 [Verrucomicrobia bacterium 61-8]|nr:LacI family DNA-binding transcriptional regulator [Verrucomicrobiota bacterium]OJV23495.1 MAG: hypothetical protein BGO12_22105 [Verrucomicrobia bacterium 61-8]
MAERISIRELASLAGVSRTTVSLALRNSHLISAKVRDRVQTLAAQYNYRSHPMIAALMQQIRVKRKLQDEEIVAFITSDPAPDGWQKWSWVVEMKQGASEEANRLGFRLEHFWAGDGAADIRTLANVLYHRGIRGLLFAPMPWPHNAFTMPWERFVAIACTTSTGIPELPVVRSNHNHGIRLLLSRLSALGARSIGVAITDEDDMRVDRGLSSGIHSFLLDNPKTKVHLLRLESYSQFKQFAQWFSKKTPDVIILARREILDFLRKLGKSPGKDIPCAGLTVDSEEMGTMAGLFQNSAYLGKKAVQYISKGIYDQSFGLPESPESIMIDAKFVEGPSLGRLLPAPVPRKRKTTGQRRKPA